MVSEEFSLVFHDEIDALEEMAANLEVQERMSSTKDRLAKSRRDIIKPDCCSHCGDRTDGLHAHHRDYSKPLAVLWLCPLCHGKEHRMERYELSA